MARVVSWCCRWVQSPNDVIRKKVEKRTKNTHTTQQNQTNNDYPQHQETPQVCRKIALGFLYRTPDFLDKSTMSTVQSFSKVGIWVSGLVTTLKKLLGIWRFLVFTMLLCFYNCTVNVGSDSFCTFAPDLRITKKSGSQQLWWFSIVVSYKVPINQHMKLNVSDLISTYIQIRRILRVSVWTVDNWLATLVSFVHGLKCRWN